MMASTLIYFKFPMKANIDKDSMRNFTRTTCTWWIAVMKIAVIFSLLRISFPHFCCLLSFVCELSFPTVCNWCNCWTTRLWNQLSWRNDSFGFLFGLWFKINEYLYRVYYSIFLPMSASSIFRNCTKNDSFYSVQSSNLLLIWLRNAGKHMDFVTVTITTTTTTTRKYREH